MNRVLGLKSLAFHLDHAFGGFQYLRNVQFSWCLWTSLPRSSLKVLFGLAHTVQRVQIKFLMACEEALSLLPGKLLLLGGWVVEVGSESVGWINAWQLSWVECSWALFCRRKNFVTGLRRRFCLSVAGANRQTGRTNHCHCWGCLQTVLEAWIFLAKQKERPYLSAKSR